MRQYRWLYILGLKVSILLSSFLFAQKPEEKEPRSPREFVKLAAKDLATVPKEIRKYIRYLELGDIEENYLEEARTVLMSHICGHLNQEPDRKLPEIIDSNLIRINILDYRWKIATWEKLIESDPLFHVRRFNLQDNSSFVDDADHLKLVKEELEYLKKETCSCIPIVNGAWFFNQTAIQDGRDPGFYDFLGIKELEDVWTLAGYDPKVEQKFPFETRAHIAISGVSKKARIVGINKARYGGFYYTFDFENTTGKSNPLRNFKKSAADGFKATEIFFVLPNFYWGTALFDSKGNRQNEAPQFVGFDKRSKSNDGKIHINASCYRCHDNAGIQDLDDFTQNLIQPPILGHFVPTDQYKTYQEYREFSRTFLRNNKIQIDEDRLRFSRAVKEVTGWEPKKYHEAYARFWEYFEDAKIDLKFAARQLGVTEKRFKEAIMKYADIKIDPQGILRTGSVDPIIGNLLLERNRKRSVGMTEWLEVLPIAHAYLEGKK